MSEEPKQSSFRITDRRGQAKEEPTPLVQPSAKREPESPPRQEAKKEPRKEPHGDEYPSIDFSTFVVSMSSSALIHMGLVKDPHTGHADKNLPLAKQEVEILTMLEEKTRGNLSKEEKRLMDEVLYELRIRFVEAARTP
ncbi:MAG TPA: DUF1844 domain-containing protein [Bdellovibrionota bacterium]|nr:DUF1844 domain-containing protein [Bdellovibrionota bacterium]